MASPEEVAKVVEELERQDKWLAKRVRAAMNDHGRYSPESLAEERAEERYNALYGVHMRLRRRICYLKARWAKQVSVDTDVG